MKQRGVASTLLGSRTLNQLKENIKASELDLSEEELEFLNGLSKPNLTFPYNLLSGAEDLLQTGSKKMESLLI